MSKSQETKRTTLGIIGRGLMNGTASIFVIVGVITIAEITLPYTAKPTVLLGGALGRLETAEIEEKDEALADMERQIAEVQRKAEEDKEIAVAQATAKAQAEAQAGAQIEIEAWKTAAQMELQRQAAVNQAELQAANTRMQQAQETTAFRKFEANVADGLCLYERFMGEVVGACGHADKVRKEISEPVNDALTVFNSERGDIMSGLAKPSQLIVGQALDQQFGKIAPDTQTTVATLEAWHTMSADKLIFYRNYLEDQPSLTGEQLQRLKEIIAELDRRGITDNRAG